MKRDLRPKCPLCGRRFQLWHLSNVYVQSSVPKWYQFSSTSGAKQCPHCSNTIKIDQASVWKIAGSLGLGVGVMPLFGFWPGALTLTVFLLASLTTVTFKPVD